MPVDRVQVSVDQFCELLGFEPKRFIGVERAGRKSTTVAIVLEPEESDMAQVSTVIPQLNTGGKRIGGKKPKGGKKGC